MPVYIKDPDAVLDYGFDWSDWLDEDETIVTSTWSIPAGLEKKSDSFNATATTVWLSGGVRGTTHVITNHIVTSEGREDDRSHMIKIRDR